MFCGQFSHTIDDKKRFKVPASMRDELGTKVYLIASPDSSTHCMFLYNEAGWQKICDALNSDDITHDQNTRRISRRILAGVVYAEVDKGGRITLNSEIKEYLGVEDDIHLVGNLNHIELWSPDEWNRENLVEIDGSADSLNIKF